MRRTKLVRGETRSIIYLDFFFRCEACPVVKKRATHEIREKGLLSFLKVYCRRENPDVMQNNLLNLSILLGSGNENNYDVDSNGE